MAKNKDQLDLSVELAERSSQMEKELMRREDEVARLKQEVVRGNRLKDGLNKKVRAAEETKAELESKRESLKQQIGSLERGKHSGTQWNHSVTLDMFPESESQRRQAELDKRAFEDILKERDALNKVGFMLHISLHRHHSNKNPVCFRS